MEKQQQQRLTPKQVIARIISVIVCAFGLAACISSLTLQTEEMGTFMASATWFSGLGAAVAASATYAATCRGREGKSYTFVAVIIIVGLAVPLFFYEWSHLYPMEIVYVTLVALAVQAILALVYRYLLIREDPEA